MLQAESSDSDAHNNESVDDDEASGEDECAGDEGMFSDTFWPEDVEVSGMMLYHDLC